MLKKSLLIGAAIAFVTLIAATFYLKGRTEIRFSRVNVIHLNSDVIPQLTFSHDGTELLVVGVEKEILFFNTSNWSRVDKLKFTRHFPVLVSCSPDGRMFAVIGPGPGVEFFDSKTRKRLFLDKHDEELLARAYFYDVPFSPDGKFFAAGSGASAPSVGDIDYLDLYEITRQGIRLRKRGQRPRWTEWGKPTAYALDFSPDGRFLAVGGGDGTLELWDVKAWKLLHRYQDPVTRADSGWAWNPKSRRLSRVAGPAALAHVGWVGYVEFSPDGTLLASADARHESSVKIWEVATGRLVHAFLLSEDPIDQTQGLDFSPDGTLLAACSMKRVAVFDVASGEKAWSKEKDNGFNSVKFSPTQPIFAFVNYPNRVDKVDIEIWRYGPYRELPSQ